MKKLNRKKIFRKNKRRKYFSILLFTFIIFAQAMVIAKLYTERQEKTYNVNLVKINDEKDSVDFPQIKTDLQNIDAITRNLQSFLKNKNISSPIIDELHTDSLSNDIYLAKVSNRYSQYLADLQERLNQVPLGIPTKGYISSQFGNRKNPIPVMRLPEKPKTEKSIPTASTSTEIVDGAPQILKIRDSLGNVVDEITIYPKIKATVKNDAPIAKNKVAAREENNSPSEADQIQFHKGLDIAVPFGSNVKAAATGIVIFSGQKGGYGNCVIISHGNGLATLYGHLSELLVKTDEKVYVNQIIAKSGNTGRSTGPHLHYEVQKNNVPVNPKLFLNL